LLFYTNVKYLIYLILIYLDAEHDDILLNSKIPIEDDILKADKSALTIDKNFPCLKIQFFFTFLNVSQVYVYDDLTLIGVITKEEFVRKSMSLDD
jgi:hypothetical protein